MRRLPALAFAVLVVASVGAFFVVQHLKVTTPLIAGFPAPTPGVINPVDGGVCNGVDHRVMRISFYLLHRSDNVDVYVINSAGAIVRTLASGRHMGRGVSATFAWNGRKDNGTLAPDGSYFIKVALTHQGRTIVISNVGGPEPVRVTTTSVASGRC